MAPSAAEGLGPDGFDWVGEILLEASGGEAVIPISARFEMRGDTLEVEAFGESKFSALGIKPYSAFLGAVKNDDQIHLYLSIRAVAASPRPTR